MTHHSSTKSHSKTLNFWATDEIFESPEQMSEAIESLVRYLNNRYAKSNDTRSGVLGFIIEHLRVEFSPRVKHLEVVTNFGQGIATILAPGTSDTKQGQEERRTELLKQFFPTLKDAQLRATIQLYRTLQLEARKSLTSKYHVSENSPTGDNEIVMVIDDDSDLLFLLSDRLKESGYRVLEANSGTQALNILENGTLPSAIIVDLNMPEVNGWQFCERLKKDRTLSNIPVLIHSSQDLSQDELSRLGGKSFVRKGKNSKALELALRSILSEA